MNNSNGNALKYGKIKGMINIIKSYEHLAEEVINPFLPNK